jgi:hypothetical protein
MLCTFGGTDANPKCKCLIDKGFWKQFGGDGRTPRTHIYTLKLSNKGYLLKISFFGLNFNSPKN